MPTPQETALIFRAELFAAATPTLSELGITPADVAAMNTSGGGGGGLSEAQVDARADARISSWVGAAPGALDTLAEIADALADDASFAATMTAALAGKQPLATVLTNTTASFTSAQETKLSGIATGATANATDAQLRDRGTHTGAQAISTVTGLQTALDGKQASGSYEAANANIQAHVGSAHAPAGAQVNADITKAEIEAKLTGAITSHSHAGGGTNTYCINVQALTSSPADGATIYFGTLPKAPVTVAATSRIYFRETATITAAEIYCYSGTAGTAESWTLSIRKNNTTDTTIAAVAAATNERVFSNAALSIGVVSGDYIEIKAVNPTWATNPLTTIFGGYIKVQT